MTVAPPRDDTTALVGNATLSAPGTQAPAHHAGHTAPGTDPWGENRNRTRRRAQRLARSRELGWFVALLGPNLALILAFTYFPLV